MSRKERGYWTFDKIKEESLKFENRSSFQKCSKSAYTIAFKKGWLDDMCSHMSNICKPKNYWSIDLVKEEALKFTKRSDFKKGSSAYSVACRKGWLDIVCSHMELQGNKYKRHIYKASFSDNSVYIGLTYNLNKRINEHLTNVKSSVNIHMVKTGIKPIFELITTELLSKEDAAEMECFKIDEYTKLGFNILNKAKGGSLGSNIIIWTFESVKEEALKFTTRSNFCKFSGSAYSVALKNDWIDDMCSHMIILRHYKGYWTYDMVSEDAFKFKTKSDFRKMSINGYSAAKRNGWLDQVCSHMINK